MSSTSLPVFVVHFSLSHLLQIESAHSYPANITRTTIHTLYGQQFYIPLFLSSIICVFAFGLFAHHLITASHTESLSSDQTAPVHLSRMAEQREAERRGVFLRLGCQLAVMMIVFLPDAFSYYATTFFADTWAYPAAAYKATGIIWKSESLMVALMWYSNLRIQAGIRGLLGCNNQAAPAEHSTHHPDLRRATTVQVHPRPPAQSQSPGSEPPPAIGNSASAKVAPSPSPDTARDRIESTAFQAVAPGLPV